MKMTKAQKKVGKVMGEFKEGTLHSGKGGKVVKNPRQAGTANTGNRTLAARGMATVWFNSATEAIISGSGLT